MEISGRSASLTQFLDVGYDAASSLHVGSSESIHRQYYKWGAHKPDHTHKHRSEEEEMLAQPPSTSIWCMRQFREETLKNVYRQDFDEASWLDWHKHTQQDIQAT